MSNQKTDPARRGKEDRSDAARKGQVVALPGGEAKEAGGAKEKPGGANQGGAVGARKPAGRGAGQKAAAQRQREARRQDAPEQGEGRAKAAPEEVSGAEGDAPAAKQDQPAAPTKRGRPAAKDAPQPAIEKRPVAPTAPPARMRGRHFVAIVTFIIVVMLPAAATAWYLWTRATDQYASYVGFTVRTEEVGSAIEILGGITELSGSSSSDTDILYKFLQSQALVRQIDEAIDLRAIWSRPGYENDPLFVYDPPGTIEDLEAQWADMVRISYDSGSGLMDLRVLAFTPDEAQLIATAIFDASSEMINELTDIAREDAIKYAREELDTAVGRLKAARTAVQEFRNRTQIVDPTLDTAGQMGLVTTLQGQLAEAIIDLDMLAGTTRQGDPRISQAQRRIDVIERRIEEEREKVGLGGAGADGQAIADIVGEYEVLTVDREFAEQSYTAALAAYDVSQAEARRQSRYLAAHVRPTLAERSDFPQRGMILVFVTLFLTLGWAIAVLVAYALRDRR